MKTIKNIFITGCVLMGLTGCDKGFEEINTNPYVINELDGSFILAHSQQALSFGSWESEGTIAQYFQNAFDLGATSGFQFNQNNNNYNQVRWGNYGGPIKNLVQALHDLDGDPSRTNLISMMRLWKALIFMNLVDTHGHVPYSEAGRAYLDQIYLPRYEDDAEIYEDLYKEIKEATAALNNSGDIVAQDLLYQGNVNNWRKFGNSLLLRLGMRYSKLDASKAASIAAEAYNGGVMETADDDAVLIYNSFYDNGMVNGIYNNNPRYYYIQEPVVTRYQLTNDPRSKYVTGKYADPSVILDVNTPPDVTLSEQQGFPVGHSNITAENLPDYPGIKESGLDYSQPNYFAMFSPQAPRFFLTASQTKLLLAEAAVRGWVAEDAEALYEEGIRTSMDQYSLYPGGYGDVSLVEQNAYIADASVAYDASNALELINTEYWISNINNPLEGWANFRRSGFPALTPNPWSGGLPGDGFVHRIPYPTQESGSNPDNYDAARAAMGIAADNSNDMTVRVFWDIP